MKMRLLLVVCLLGAWPTTFLDLVTAENSTTVFKANHISSLTTQMASSFAKQSDFSTMTRVTNSVMTSTENETGNHIAATNQSTATSSTVTAPTPTTSMQQNNPTDVSAATTTQDQKSTTAVQPKNATSSSTLHQTDSTASTTQNSTTQGSTKASSTERSPTTSVKETISPVSTTTADPGQVESRPTQTPEISNSTSFHSTATNITVTQATTSSPQTNETVSQSTSTEGFFTNITTTEWKSKHVSRGEQDAVTAMTQGNETNMIIKVSCVPEPSEENNYLELKENITCKTYVDEKGQELGKLLCSRLIKKGNHKGYSHCMVELSKVKTSNRRLNVDISFKVNTNDIKNVLSETKNELKELGIQFSANQEHRNELQTPSELKKRIAMVVTGSLLLLIFLSAIVYRCSQRKSQKKKDQYLTEEIQPVDNGCHDNLAMDITESEPEMQEKPSSKVNMQDNMDNWIVPMDSLTKDELEEEDTHL